MNIDFSVITDSVNLLTVVNAILAVALIILGIKLVIHGCNVVLGMIDHNNYMRDEEARRNAHLEK